MAKILSALDDQSLKVSKVMSIKSATGKKRSISPSHGILSIFTRISGHLRCLAGARWNCLWVYCCIEHVICYTHLLTLLCIILIKTLLFLPSKLKIILLLTFPAKIVFNFTGNYIRDSVRLLNVTGPKSCMSKYGKTV